jgi:hypothetical protein
MSAARIFECLELGGSDCSVVTKGVKAAAKVLQMPIKGHQIAEADWKVNFQSTLPW